MQEYRVMVQLNDMADEEYYASTQRKSVSLQDKYKKIVKTELELLDKSNLILKTTETFLKDSIPKTQKAQQFYFDYIDYASKSATRIIIEQVMDQLLNKQQSCCLIRCSLLRECQIKFLINLLVLAVDKRLRLYSLNLISINLQCYLDVHRFNVISLLDKAEHNRNLRTLPPKRLFHNTLELLNWLESDYFHLWLLGSEHECMDFEFTLTNAQKQPIKLSFSIVNFYLSLMSSDTKNNLGDFFKNHISKVKHTMITDSIREYFTTKWSLNIIFDIPVIPNGDLVIKDMLKIASSAYMGMVKLQERKLNSEFVRQRSSNCITACRDAIKNIQNNLVEYESFGDNSVNSAEQFEENLNCVPLCEDGNIEEIIKKFDDEIECIKTEKESEEVVKENEQTENKNIDDYVKDGESVIMQERQSSGAEKIETLKSVESNLDRENAFKECFAEDNISIFYDGIDHSFKTVLTAMQNYYKHKFTDQMSNINNDIKNLIHENQNEIEAIQQRNKRVHKEMQKYSGIYHTALVTIQDLEDEVKKSKYAGHLFDYLEEKKSYLTECSLQFKIIQLAQCMSSIQGTIGAELSLLKSAIESNSTKNKHNEY
ncbi:uncharacterized protein LOC119685110 [Teleopsis dalmanni]|uniref:uncharacterized protein LOC119685110 n=1 Tax=Teleopsis dalmanni TaxID=139649 RepID=UPI0018CF0646|nr:uncharacterized protein LOC119685110 [Teleopsis dalmanni]